MKECFISHRFNSQRMVLIQNAIAIVEEYTSAGYRLTLRQLYYQFVSRNLLPNTERSYKNLGAAISEARLAGLIDWTAIEDRVRVPRSPSEFDNLRDLVDAAIASYRLPRWNDQDYYLELWVEKDALAGVLMPLASEYHVTMMVNRGYSSQSAMYWAAKRFLRAGEMGKQLVLLYLGDHDPSGEDMVRDIRERMEMFGVTLEVKKIALTMEQVRQYNPPPNPAKMSDSRAEAYVERHGDESWEVDALPPDVLETLIRSEIEAVVDLDKIAAVKAKEERDKKALVRAAKKIGQKKRKKKKKVKARKRKRAKKRI